MTTLPCLPFFKTCERRRFQFHFRTMLALVAIAGVTLAADAIGQGSGPTKTAEQIRKLIEDHRNDFAYLLGDWEFVGTNPDGSFHGRWSAVRLPTGQILDEFRVLGDTGQTYALVTTVRAYNAVLEHWDVVGVDSRGMGLQNIGTAERVGDEIHLLQKFGAGTPGVGISRVRYYAIGPSSFSWLVDRSADGGKTWILNYQRIEATRVALERPFTPLTQFPKR